MESQIDATSHYTLEDWNDRKGLLRQLRDKSDPYNTRLRKGLPPTPIGAPGISALNATLSPETSEYWYYLHDLSQTIRQLGMLGSTSKIAEPTMCTEWHRHSSDRADKPGLVSLQPSASSSLRNQTLLRQAPCAPRERGAQLWLC